MSRLTPWAKGHLDVETVICGQENPDYMIIDDVAGLAEYLLGISEGVSQYYNGEHPDESAVEIAITFARKLSNGTLQLFIISKDGIEYGLSRIPANTSIHVDLATKGSTEPPPIMIVASTR